LATSSDLALLPRARLVILSLKEGRPGAYRGTHCVEFRAGNDGFFNEQQKSDP